MKKTIDKIAILLLMAFAVACVDEEKDPVKFDKIAKGTFLALRGDAFNALNATGCSNSFFKNNLIGDEVYSVDADFLSEDQESLQEVQLYASVLTTTKGGLSARARKLVATVPGSAFTFPSGSAVKRGNFSVTLAKIMTELSISADSLVKLGYVYDANDEPATTSDITMDVDLVLKDGSKVLASDIVNPNLFQSVVFYPAMVLNYCANDQEDFRPLATPSLLGTWGLTTDGKKVSRTKIPSLKSGAKDTLYFTYDNPILDIADISITYSPAGAGSATSPVKAKKVDANGFYTKDDSNNGFYVIYTANGSFTGAVTATISGAKANVAGVELVQATKKQTINVDNTAPILVGAPNTGKRIGEGQFVTMKVTFNEKLSTKSANAIKVTVDGSTRGLETITDAKMTVASDGLSASLIYIFKRAAPLTPATHGNLSVVFSDAIDEAGNTTTIPPTPLTVDVGTPPAPTLALSGTWDLGTQISWTAAQTTGGSNPGGSTSGKVYFIALPTGDDAPTKFSVDLDGVATWLGNEDDPDDETVPPAKLPIAGSQKGIVTVTDGASASPAFTPFTANNSTIGFDIYAVFVSSSGTISDITPTPQLTGVLMQ